MGIEKETTETIVDDLQDEYDGAVRGVGCFADGKYRVDYLRGDVREELGEAKAHEILKDAQLGSLGHPAYENLYDSELEGVVRIFERSVVLTIPVTDTAGVLVSLDRTGEFHGRTVIETVEDHLPETEETDV